MLNILITPVRTRARPRRFLFANAVVPVIEEGIQAVASIFVILIDIIGQDGLTTFRNTECDDYSILWTSKTPCSLMPPPYALLPGYSALPILSPFNALVIILIPNKEIENRVYHHRLEFLPVVAHCRQCLVVETTAQDPQTFLAQSLHAKALPWAASPKSASMSMSILSSSLCSAESQSSHRGSCNEP